MSSILTPPSSSTPSAPTISIYEIVEIIFYPVRCCRMAIRLSTERKGFDSPWRDHQAALRAAGYHEEAVTSLKTPFSWGCSKRWPCSRLLTERTWVRFPPALPFRSTTILDPIIRKLSGSKSCCEFNFSNPTLNRGQQVPVAPEAHDALSSRQTC